MSLTSSISKRSRKKPELLTRDEAEAEGLEIVEDAYFCDYCGAGQFEHSWEKATHVRNCEKAKEAKSKAEA